MNSSAVSLLLVVVVTILLLGLLSAVSAVDVAGPVRSFLWERDARKMQRHHHFPETLERAYWSRRQYDRDSPRLRALGYRVTSEEAVDPFITMPSYPMFGRTSGRPRRRRVPCIYVHYAYDRTAAAVR
jgi:hypothetical protein